MNQDQSPAQIEEKKDRQDGVADLPSGMPLLCFEAFLVCKSSFFS
jgi:hypothetical protein